MQAKNMSALAIHSSRFFVYFSNFLCVEKFNLLDFLAFFQSQKKKQFRNPIFFLKDTVLVWLDPDIYSTIQKILNIFKIRSAQTKKMVSVLSLSLKLTHLDFFGSFLSDSS